MMARKQTTEAPAVSNGSPKKRSSADSDNHDVKRPRLQESTDKARWRLSSEGGRHTWHYLEDDEATKEWPQSYADKYFLGMPLVKHPAVSSHNTDVTC